MSAALRPLRRVGQLGAGGFDKVGVAHRLGQAPMRHGVVKHPARSRCALGLSRYSAMLLGFAPLERGKVEQLRLPALLALDQCLGVFAGGGEILRSHDCHPRRWPSLLLRWPRDQRSH